MSEERHLSCIEAPDSPCRPETCDELICWVCEEPDPSWPCPTRRAQDAESAIRRVRDVCEDKYVGPSTTYGEGFQNGYNDALYRVLRALNALCPICSGPIRETVGLVCQTCGTDYGASDE